MKIWQMTFVACALSAAGMASAGVTPVGEFTGDLSEGFENIFPPGGYPGPIPLFGGEATMDDTLAHFCVIAFVWSNPNLGEVFPYNGNLMGGTVAGSTIFEFQTPVKSFGGFLTTVGFDPGGSVVFRDVQGATIDTLSATIEPLLWTWQGWTSDVPIGSIEVIGAGVPGFSTIYDDLQVSFVPAPGSLGALIVGVGLASRRRR
jgi:hypothetical protein